MTGKRSFRADKGSHTNASIRGAVGGPLIDLLGLKTVLCHDFNMIAIKLFFM